VLRGTGAASLEGVAMADEQLDLGDIETAIIALERFNHEEGGRCASSP
jgi:hypothetical protein